MHLSRLGIHGLDALEDALLAALVTGDPLLLVGRHGSAKTMLVARIAAELGLRFHAYDASKALFEDVLGFPDPRGLAEGRLDYVPTPISLWDKEFVLVDELSRATPQLQSKWLEIVRSRRVMGRNAPRLKYVWAAMNPPDYLGAQPLDDALLGRFAWVIRVPGVHELGPDDVRAVVETVGDDDAPALRRRTTRPRAASDLRAIVRRARRTLPRIERSLGRRLTDYVVAVETAMQLARVPLDGRRLGFIRRNAASLLAVRVTKTDDTVLAFPAVEGTLLEALRLGVPFAAQDRPVGEHVAVGAHRKACRLLATNDRSLRAQAKVLLADGPLGIARSFVENADDLTPADRADVVTRIEDDLYRATETRTVAEAVLGLRVLLSAHGTLRSDTARRAATLYARLTARPGFHGAGRLSWRLARRRVRKPGRRREHRQWPRELGRRVGANLEELDPTPPLGMEGEELMQALSDHFVTLLGEAPP